MKLRLVGLMALLGAMVLLLSTMAPTAGAVTPQELFGHNNSNGRIYKIDTSDGSRVALPNPTGIGAVASGMATSRGPVPAPGNIFYAAGTHFGLLANKVVVVDTVTGSATVVVTTSRGIGGRGIAFGPDGVTLYVIESSGVGRADLSTIDTVTGLVTEVGHVEDADRDYPSASLEFDPDTDTFYAISRSTVVNVDPATAAATIVGALGDLGFGSCTLVRSPGGTWFGRQGSRLVIIDIATGTKDSNVGPGLPMNVICGTAFAPEKPLTEVCDSEVTFQPDPSSFQTDQNAVGPNSPAGTFSFDATLTNTGGSNLTNIGHRILTLTNGNKALNFPESPAVEGDTVTTPLVDDYADGTLGPGESAVIPWVIGLQELKLFDFFVNVECIKG